MKDFDLKKIAESGQVFRANPKDEHKWEFIALDKRIVLDERSDFYSEIKEDSFWSHYFDLERDYESVRREAEGFNDSFMVAACNAGEGIRMLNQDPWEMLISFIISQRKSIPSIKTSIERLCKNFGRNMGDFYAFPTPEKLYNADESVLSSCGLGYRLEYIKDAARRVFLKEMDPEEMSKLDDDRLSEALKEVKGVGEKVANCVMLFAYGRTGRVPVDTWVKKIMEEDYKGENPFPKYGNDAGILQQYAFYYKRNIK